jgi:hypothetical protein
MAPLARVHDNEVVVSWQVGVAAGSSCTWCREVWGGQCSHHPLNLDIDGLVLGPLVLPAFPRSFLMSVTGLALALTWHGGCGM